VATVDFDADGGRWALHVVDPTVPASTIGSHCSEIKVSPDGRWLYVANRGHDSLARFSIAESTGELTAAGHISTQGKTPRHFAFDPSGAFLVVANQDSDTLKVFAVDSRTGALNDQGPPIRTGSPTCVCFVKSV
jgi:6-phosphogluconolactonase